MFGRTMFAQWRPVSEGNVALGMFRSVKATILKLGP